MSNTNWRKYGGLNNLAKDNNITTRVLVCDDLVLRNAYVGTFTIDGGLVVADDAQFGKNVDISGNITAQKIQINSGFVFSDLSINGNLEVLQNTIMKGSLNLNDYLYFGEGANSFLYGNQSQELLGLNTNNPQSTLDIVGNTSEVLNIFSNQPTNRNIIARNQNSHGMVVQTSDISSALQFYNDTTINSQTSTRPDAQIQYINGGFLEVDASNTQLFSQLSISTLSGQNTHLKDETAIIYDISNGKYLYNIYDEISENTGNALTLVATDSNSVTFLNILTPDLKGLEIGGGAYPNDQTRSMGTLGYNDNLGNYVPVENIVSGSSNVKLRATTGFNTFAPRTESYTLDINGPVHITNGQITPVIDTSFQVIETNYNGIIGISVGTPSTISQPYIQNILYTNNGGQSWNKSNINSGDLQTAENNFNAIYVYNSSYAFVGGSQGFFYYTNNGGVNWYQISLGIPTNPTTISIYVCPSPTAGKLRVFFMSNPLNVAEIIYFDIPTSSSGIFAASITLIPTASLYFTKVTNVNGDGTYFYVTGRNSSGNDFIVKYTVNTPTAVLTATPGALYNYNSIYVLNPSIVIAVGTGSIYWTTNGGTTWTNNTTIPETLNSVYILDGFRAIAVGNNGTLVYSDNSYQTWQTIPYETLNASGNASSILSYNLINAYMTDINTILITATVQTYTNGSQYGASRQFYLYLPNLFNRINNSVLDISGDAFISGDLHINDGGNIISNDISFSLINTNVQSINFGGNATSITMAYPLIGNTTINNNLTVLGYTTTTEDISLNGNIYVNNDININNGVIGQQGYDIAIGINAGQNGQQSGSIAIGYSAGQKNQGSNSIAIGNGAGVTNQNANSIILNASGNNLNSTTSGTFINPIRQTTIQNANLLAYDYSGITSEVINVQTLKIDTGGNLIVTNASNATGPNTGAIQILGGISIEGNSYISGGISIEGNSIMGNSYVGKTFQTNTIQPTGNTITIGAGLSNTINIGNIGNPSYLYSDTINIGGTYDFVNLGGNVTSTAVNNLVVNNKTITLNAGSITNYSSAASGFIINDNNNTYAGYFLLDLSMNGYIFKAPNQYQNLVTNGNINNIVDLNINSLINASGIDSGILMLQPSGTLHTDSSFVLNVAPLDISNILIRSKALSTNTNQVVETDMTTNGNLYINNNLTTNGNLYINNDLTFINSSINNYNIGYQGGYISQQPYAISFGYQAGYNNQGTQAIAIGYNAGITNQTANSIILNASGNIQNATETGLYINPIRQANINNANILAYDYSGSTKEVINVQTLRIDTGGNLTVGYNEIILGNLAIGIPNPSYAYNLDISGTARATSFNATSDYRIKANIQNLNDTFSVDYLRPIYYFNKEANKEDIGFIAHEVQEHYPYLVSGEKDGQQFQALNYNGIMGILVKDVKECKAEIKRLKREMAELLREDKIKKAKKEIEQLKLNNEKMSNNYRH